MSLKSFDKFCEKIILGEPGSQKEIFDERQNILRSKLTIEALTIFAAAAILNCLVIEEIYKWAESQLAALIVLLSACLLYWQCRCAAKGCMIGTNGKFMQTFSGVYIIFMGIIGLLRFLPESGEPDFLIKDGALSKNFLAMTAMILFIITGIITLIAIKMSRQKD